MRLYVAATFQFDDVNFVFEKWIKIKIEFFLISVSLHGIIIIELLLLHSCANFLILGSRCFYLSLWLSFTVSHRYFMEVTQEKSKLHVTFLKPAGQYKDTLEGHNRFKNQFSERGAAVVQAEWMLLIFITWVTISQVLVYCCYTTVLGKSSVSSPANIFVLEDQDHSINTAPDFTSVK